MRTFVKSLRRLYLAGRMTDVRVAELRESGKITEDEYEYVVGE